MNFKLAREIYGSPWLMDAISLQKYTAMLKDMRNGMQLDIFQGEKDNDTLLQQAKLLSSQSAINSTASDEIISVTMLTGAITKYGGDSHYGTVEMATHLQLADKNPKVIGHILQIDSGGGSANAVNYLTSAIQNLEKPIIAYIDGMAASAAYYIAAYADYIIAHNQNDIVGSIGTMIEFQGFKKIDQNVATGERVVRVYADGSEMKNKAFENAINNLDMKMVKEKILNPANEQFHADMQAQRVNISKEQLTGDTFKAGEVVGTMIDALGTIDDAINQIYTINENQKNQKTNIMTKKELQANDPSLYAEILGEGIAQERDRVAAIMTYADIDLKSAQTLIDSGEQPTQKFYAEMNRKALAKQILTDSENNIPAVEVAEEVKENAEEVEEAKILAEALEAIGIESK